MSPKLVKLTNTLTIRVMTIAICLFTVLLANCEPPENGKIETLNGTYQSMGYGWVLSIEDSTTYTFYDEHAIGCKMARSGPFTELLPCLGKSGDTLLVNEGVLTYRFLPIQVVPTNCATPISDAEATDPLFNLDYFASMVKEHYAFFGINAVNWDSLYMANRQKVSASPNDVTLYASIEAIFAAINDQHAYLEVPDAVYEAYEEAFPQEPQSEESELPFIGGFATALEKMLPNGWPFSLSNEVYLDAAGNNYENAGVPVDRELDYSRERQPFFHAVLDDRAGDRAAILNIIEEL